MPRHGVRRALVVVGIALLAAPVAAVAASGATNSGPTTTQISVQPAASTGSDGAGASASVALSATLPVNPAFGAVTQVAVPGPPPPAFADASTGPNGQATTTQLISIPVRAGNLSVSPANLSVSLGRHDRPEGHGDAFGPIVVTDARGSLAGWTLSARAVDEHGDPVPISIDLGPVVALTGRPGEAFAAHPGQPQPGQPVVLMTAAAGGGGGIFEISGSVSAHSRSDEGTVVLQLTVS
jgi:hypothetical protein